MDGLCFKSGGISSSLPFNVGGGIDARTLSAQVSPLGRGNSVSATASAISVESSAAAAATAPSPSASSSSSGRYSSAATPRPLEKRNDEIDPEKELEGEEIEAPLQSEKQPENWVLKILYIGSVWSENRRKSDGDAAAETVDSDRSRCSSCDDEGSDGCRVDDGDEVGFDKESFSRLLRRVSLVEAKVYAQMSYLGSLAYAVGKIKPGNLLKYQGLRFVTSSLVKKAQTLNSDKEQVEGKSKTMNPEKQAFSQTPDMLRKEEDAEGEKQRNNGYRISASATYQIAATAASYLQSHTSSFLPFSSAKTETVVEDSLQVGSGDSEKNEITSPEVASFVATTNSVTAVVAGEEEMKQAVAKDLSSARSSPCEWFICDDERCGTRFFVIQGSESLASWQTNLLFEPVQFEGLDVLVHRGIYEAAKGIYEQMLPEVRAHLKSRGNFATLRFTGHSLGGSLALLVSLMLLIRGEVPLSSLLPVITFGAPSIMCGGDYLLQKLGLPQKYVQAIMMHRDIVPRAFSCSYPDRVAELLRAVNGNFRNHPCLKNQKLLYAPMGELLILQPDEKFSPHHDLLPSGSGLYLLGRPISNSDDWARQLKAAKAVFLNSPHPLEILSDPAAYGSDGAIYRDHDMNSYLRSVRDVIRQELKHIRKAKREQRGKAWWPLVAAQGLHASIVVGRGTESASVGQHQLNFSGVFRSGRESLKRFSRLVASQHMHMLVVLLLPAKSLLLETFSVTGFN